ncbi:hypothetical protein HDA32_004743 [Spinactinospora alkalitolerans]|uniref:Uncharacterized protein n=1 Tax=Spinactinospora alkalitolerans TaxID=687207 RepID=A0A852U3Y1_9ACTN|nr:hypothetical protein [Spinactinospora alkalitolerans]NYE49623.1 hypothetical protein [Spinactinospora alkalitolerans]
MVDSDLGGLIADARQNRRLDALQEELSSARANARAQDRRLRSELSRVQGTLEQRLDRMSASFDAFVELSDVRALLAMFDEPALARHRAGQLLDGTAPASLELPDVPGYWLVPAARGLHVALRGDVGAARRHFTEAAQRDALSSGVFALLGTATAGPGPDPGRAAPFADWILPRLLPELPDEVARDQRALWLLAADGLLGAGARELLHGHAAAALDRGTDPSADVAFWEAFEPTGDVPKAPSGLEGTRAVLEQTGAASRLAALRAWLEESLRAGEEAPAPDPSVAETLRLLVAEGSAEEVPLLVRVAQLRRVVESNGGASPDEPVPTWRDPAGETLALLREDAAGSGVPAARRAFAIGVHAPRILAAAERLAAQGRRTPDDAAVAVHRRHRVTVTGRGPDDAELRAAEARLEREYAYSGKGNLYAAISAGAAVVLAVVAFAVEPGIHVLTVAAAAVAVWQWLKGQRERDGAAEALEHERARLRARVAAGAANWRDLTERANALAAGAGRDLAAIRALL